MLVMAIGFTSVSVILSYNFFRKYRAQLQGEVMSKRYSRIADYYGQPMRVQFDYLQEGSETWSHINVNVSEIYHYGKDYFLKGTAGKGIPGRSYKHSRMLNLKIEEVGYQMQAFERLLNEVEQGRSQAVA
jgi:hypothetical protein